MKWNKLMVLFALFLMGQITRAAVDPASSIDKGSLISNPFFNTLKREELDPITPVAIPIQSALDSQQRKKRAGDTSTFKICASVFDDARNGFSKSDDDWNFDCYISTGESILVRHSVEDSHRCLGIGTYPPLVGELRVLNSLSLPFSNAIAERAFSVVNQVKTPLRNNFHNVSLSSLILAQQWLKNKQASSASIEVPEGMKWAALIASRLQASSQPYAPIPDRSL
ncbi:hypothetical protein DAPPUDRAFT_117672 [Daphnia pulex]|uniref:HAT C-terminal dimerisation domain-containing protein n=1 Tax=Daphnia pulex TaxID=6669 RepID=E9HTF5_DAPPU|nr:hypothetical protein DAPPUDRAFT_117672 [Daphnia pulex]|eukprot:EFX64976.1 hypothetical protein DAPPUDRAFT_117672 [Daphnia pulex]